MKKVVITNLSHLTNEELTELENLVEIEKSKREDNHDRDLAKNLALAMEEFMAYVDYPNLPCEIKHVMALNKYNHAIEVRVDGMSPTVLNGILTTLWLFANRTI